MPATEFRTSTAVTESAVSETMKRMNATALDLLSRRVEVNRRIRCLQQVMRGLRDLAIKSAFNEHDGPSIDAGYARRRPFAGTTALRHTSRSTPDCRLPNSSTNVVPGLSRACRIALMESGTASLEEIRARILRRGSFSFADFRLANEAITRTLNVMTDDGEICRLEIGSQWVWQRIAMAEVDTYH
jgi:hypothetical protein